MKFPYSHAVAEKIETIVGRQLTETEFNAIKCVVENAAENFAEEIKRETINDIRDGFSAVIRKTA